MVSTAGTAVSVFPEWRFPNAGLRGHGGRNIHDYICIEELPIMFWYRTNSLGFISVNHKTTCTIVMQV